MFTSTITIEGRLAEEAHRPGEPDRDRGADEPEQAQRGGGVDQHRHLPVCRQGVQDPRHQGRREAPQGDQVIVVGSIVTDTWKDNDTDQNRYRQTVLAEAIGTSL